jgi:hypothetical protein
MAEEEEKHKTVGVSFPPALRSRASERARGLGLSFSKYVTACVEAELNGTLPQLVMEPLLASGKGARPGEGKADVNLDDAIRRGHELGEMKALSIAFEDDIEGLLKAHDWCYSRFEKIAHMRADFLVQHTDPRTDATRRVVLECRYNIRNRYTVTLGQTIIWKSLPGVDAVVLCVPYLVNFDAHMHQTFAAQDIQIATPDSLNQVLEGSLT